MFRPEALPSSEVWDEHSSRGGHQLLPAQLLRSLWKILDAGLHLLFQVNHPKSVMKF